MRRTLFTALAVLLVSAAVMTAALIFLNRTVNRAEALLDEAVLAEGKEDAEMAAERVTQLAAHWEERTPVLEVVADHDALEEVARGIAEARICLECDDHDDFLRCMSGVKIALNHIRDEEALRWSNLY